MNNETKITTIKAPNFLISSAPLAGLSGPVLTTQFKLNLVAVALKLVPIALNVSETSPIAPALDVLLLMTHEKLNWTGLITFEKKPRLLSSSKTTLTLSANLGGTLDGGKSPNGRAICFFLIKNFQNEMFF